MKKITLSLGLAALALLYACGNSNGKSKMEVSDSVKSDSTLVAQTDEAKDSDTSITHFFEMAAIGGMIEVESGNKMIALTTDPKVKDLAKMMVRDHSKANQELKALADRKGFRIPQVLPAAQIEKIKTLATFREEGRNDYYVKMMIQEHNNAIDLFSLASRSGDKAVADFAAQKLPVLKAHYAHVTKIDSLLATPIKQGDDPLKLSNKNRQGNP